MGVQTPAPLRRASRIGLSILLVVSVLGITPQRAAAAQDPQIPGFEVSVAFAGLTNPVAVEFAPDGRVFVMEKAGVVKVFDSVTDPTADVAADFSQDVHDFWDRGSLGLALDPDFLTEPFVYVLYTWDDGDTWGDACPNPPGATQDGCIVDGRLSRFEIDSNNTLVGSEQVLLEGYWCQQYPSHTVGDLAFDVDGALIVSAGDGASFTFTDYGQQGSPLNPCGDPPNGVGGTQTPPTAEGGALRSLDLLTTGDPLTFDGAVIRVDRATGDPLSTNPLDGGVASDDRFVAFGLRNPFRIVPRPGTREIWIGDVGWNTWEEINRILDPTDQIVENFGWPCYEGPARQSGYDAADLDLCEGLYDGSISSDLAGPYFAMNHASPPPGCTGGGSSITGLAFYEGGPYPPEYDGALFYANYSDQCIRVMYPDSGGDPDTTNVATIVMNTGVVDLEIGADGDLFFVDLDADAVFRLRFPSGNHAPVADLQASATAGAVPLTVSFDGSASSDADGDPLTYEWDLDGDGDFDDSTSPSPSFTYTNPGLVTVKLRVTDTFPEWDVARVDIQVDPNDPPAAVIDEPSPGSTWFAGQPVDFSGHGEDPNEGTLTGSSLHWEIILHHCVAPGNCHAHVMQELDGDGGTVTGPDHELPSTVEFRLTVTDAGDLTDATSVILDPESVMLTFNTSPGGLDLVIGSDEVAAPHVLEAVVGGNVSVSAPSPQTTGGYSYSFDSWSDGGAATHLITVPAIDTTYIATFLNGSPTASDDAYSLSEGATLDTGAASLPGVLANDSDPENDSLVATVVDQPLHGVLLLAPDGSFTYTHDGSETTSDSFTYRATDGLTSSAAATVDLAITNVVGVTFLADPLGLPVAIDGQEVPTPAYRDAEVGDTFDVAGAGHQNVGGVEYAFKSWSDGGAPQHTITVGTDDVSYVAAYEPWFNDVAGNLHESDIEYIWQRDITKGCSSDPPLFCPHRRITRGQIAAMMVRAFSFDPTDTDYFTDDDGHLFEAEINALAAAGITRGCGPGSYCPDRFVTRGQLAAFFVRAFGYRWTSGIDWFADDENSIFEGDINALRDAGITKGCSPGRFCAEDPVSRAQFAAFVTRALKKAA